MTTFDSVLRAHAHTNPYKPAVIDGPVQVSYADLDHRVDELARRLVEQGVGGGDRVMIVADNSWRFLVTAFAVWRAKGTLVTVYSSSRESEIAHAASSTAPRLVVASERIVETVRSAIGADTPVWAIETAESLPALGSATRATPAQKDVPLALICYTSGSTAKAKAVMHTGASLFAAASAYQRLWHLGADDVTLVPLPMAWAYGLVTTSMATLIGGGTVVVLPRANPHEMFAAMATHRVSFFAGVTTMFVKLVHSLRADPDVDLASLRLCISAGEPRNEPIFDEWRTISGVPVHDLYAASECFPVATYDPLEDPAPRLGSAGRVVPGAELRIVGPDGRDVAPGETGEAWTRGPGFMSGYWGEPELTAAALKDGWYHTNDLVRLDEDGYLYVVGRLSDMIIRGGSNVSPAEVEGVLGAHTQIREAAVVGLPDEQFGERVVAVVVTEAQEPSAEALRAFCCEHLASYKVPSEFVFVAELPRNPNTGKVARRNVVDLLSTEVRR
ncbi:class I adenylate-forming enzyme family protein [Rhodococcus opacus]|uniref:class I adenylate-forming enzyme family protein n=1 Tax=Rhodococcus opacus TaxID=37919 RepID=UPI00155A7117|nr:class I adenylate-forming enzyme family protein [Rhodococcus opacus]